MPKKKKNDQALLIARSVEDPQKSEQKTGAFIGEHDDHLAHQLIGIQIFTVKWGVSILRHMHIALINLVSNWQVK